MLRRSLLVLGIVLALLGAMWIAQGLGYLRWPAISPMLGRHEWANRGSIVAVAGLLVILFARRLRR